MKSRTQTLLRQYRFAVHRHLAAVTPRSDNRDRGPGLDHRRSSRIRSEAASLSLLAHRGNACPSAAYASWPELEAASSADRTALAT